MGSLITPSPAPPASRGRTVIADRVRRRLIERAVLSVDGVAHRRAIVPGRTLPSITVRGAGHSSLTVDVEIAARWPVDTATVVEDVRGAVARELATLAEHPARIGVEITRIDTDRTPAQVADAYAATECAEGAAGAPAAPTRHSPRRIAGSTITGVLIALALVAVGCIAIRDTAVAAGWITGGAWISLALHWAPRAHWQWWVWPSAVLGVGVGLTLLVVALKPRRRTHVHVGDGVWVPRAMAREWTDDDVVPPLVDVEAGAR
ncbi:hypothetical protein [Mycolicibacterium brisbanense]